MLKKDVRDLLLILSASACVLALLWVSQVLWPMDRLPENDRDPSATKPAFGGRAASGAGVAGQEIQAHGLRREPHPDEAEWGFKHAASHPQAGPLDHAADGANLDAQRRKVFSYSRSGNFDDTRSRLKLALALGIISENEYYGELGHMLSIPTEESVKIIREILESGSSYGGEVMFAALSGNVQATTHASPDERAEIFKLIDEAKPEIGGYINELGVSNVSRYANWVNALRAYAADEDGFYKALDMVIKSRMQDPREVFAVKHALRNEDFLARLSAESAEKYAYSMRRYLESYPDNQLASMIGHQ